MEKSKTPPQPLMKRVVYPFVLGGFVYLISSSIFFVLVFLFMTKWTRGLAPFFFFFGYPISFLVLGPLLTLAFAFQRSSLWRRDKRKIAALVAKQK